jgi:uroporphyrinogen decarboxylase
LFLSGLLLDVLGGKTVAVPPLWMMRQAGRYLPEYREIKAKIGSFWNMCMTPEVAAEITMQPVRRFGFDAAIIFSDILVIPAALGMEVSFEERPKLVPVLSADKLEWSQEYWAKTLAPVYDAMRLVRGRLEKKTSFIGFAGGPWTLAAYMAGGGSGNEKVPAKLWSYRDPDGFQKLIDILTGCISEHLVNQLKAGADTIQIFESAASGLTPSAFARWVTAPTTKIVAKVRAAVPRAKIIGFPRGATLKGYELYARDTGVDAVSLDTTVPIDWAVETLGTVLQGNLDPLALVAGGDALTEAVETILQAARGTRFIFNLGHGILPDTPIAHVEQLVRLVRSTR